jgi:hypothetical protein
VQRLERKDLQNQEVEGALNKIRRFAHNGYRVEEYTDSSR